MYGVGRLSLSAVMRRLLLFATALCLGFTVSLLAVEPATLTVRLTGEPGTPTTAEVRLHVGDREPERKTATVPGLVTFRLAAPALVTVEIAAPHAWAESRSTYVDANRELDLRLVASGVVRGRLAAMAGAALPERMQVSWSAAGDAANQAVASRTADCTIAGSLWTCEVPRGSHDLRIGMPGHVPHFFWSVAIDPLRPFDAGVLKLRRGSSVSGRVRAADGTAPTGTRLSLRPRTAATSEEELTRRAALAAATATADAHGFFQFAGVAPGDYELRVEHPEFAPTRVAPVTVLDGIESALKETVVLRRAIDAEVRVTPPVDPWKRPWHVRLETVAPDVAPSLAATAAVDAEGRHRFRNIGAGEYVSVVTTAAGTVWLEQRAIFDATAAPVELKVPVVPIRGTVRLGKVPLAASLSFGAASTSEYGIELTSDEDGAFEGALPREGEWRVDVVAGERHVHRTMKSVNVRRAAGAEHANVELALPATVVHGRLVDEHGTVREGWVTARDRGTSVQIRSDSGGRFRLEGAMAGELVLSALAPGLSSGEVTISVPADEQELAPVTLVLRPRQWLEGAVSSAGGPVIGARVLGRPASRPFGTSFPVTTDAEGRFKLRLDEPADFMIVTVMAPGFALEQRRVAVAGPLQIVLNQAGGTLELSGQPAGADAPLPFIEYAGEYLPLGVLRTWSQMNGAAAADPRALRVTQLPAGSYVVCTPRAAQTHADLIGRPRAPRQCVNGFLPSGGTLRLAIP